MSLISGSKARSMRSGHSGMEATYADKKSKALQAKNTLVITYDELERIKGMCK
jgi:hypothetical protein|tara:strand:- start:1601 stop:1759 length:159 start_codon:yes stop_codon:yes gene_type:complete